MGISTTIFWGMGYPLLAGWVALPADFSPTAVPAAVQTYRFGDQVVIVASQQAVAAFHAELPPTEIVIQPAAFVQSAESPPLPLDDVPAPPEATEPIPCATPVTPAVAHASRYAEIYQSIPFSRTEYDHNPTYRHDATMELLLGQHRPRPPVQQTSVNVDVTSGGGWGWPYHRTLYGYGWPRFHSNFYPSGISGTRVFVSE